MKKLLFLTALAFAFLPAVNAQQRTFSKSADTAIDAATVNLTAPSTGYSHTTTIVLSVEKVSGTVAGTAIIQGSHDGSNFATISADTLTLANASQTKAWSLGEAGYNYYRIKYTTTGTQRSVPRATILFRK